MGRVNRLPRDFSLSQVYRVQLSLLVCILKLRLQPSPVRSGVLRVACHLRRFDRLNLSFRYQMLVIYFLPLRLPGRLNFLIYEVIVCVELSLLFLIFLDLLWRFVQAPYFEPGVRLRRFLHIRFFEVFVDGAVKLGLCVGSRR